MRGCPYRGLLPFGESDAGVFYGRERLAAELAVKLADRASSGGLVVVTGGVGVGQVVAAAAGRGGEREVHLPDLGCDRERPAAQAGAADLAGVGGDLCRGEAAVQDDPPGVAIHGQGGARRQLDLVVHVAVAEVGATGAVGADGGGGASGLTGGGGLAGGPLHHVDLPGPAGGGHLGSAGLVVDGQRCDARGQVVGSAGRLSG